MNVGKRYSHHFRNISETSHLTKENNSIRTKENAMAEKKSGKKIIKDYLMQKDVAPWFRGTSHFHMHGADKLLNALRDDAEQSTTHRVRACLNLIGLEPMITSKEIKFLMHLSKGNDLVFLWFLMEMHYKTSKRKLSKSYSINEQLICSAICHLDMITTLRELDKILPSGHTSRIEMKKSSFKRQKVKDFYKKQNYDITTNDYELPYFGKIPRPQHYGKVLYLDVPNFRVDFDIYSCYNNPNHMVQNEYNRWHSHYLFNPAKRIAHLVIREIIANIFNDLKKSTSKYQNQEILCDYHNTLKIIKINLQHESNVEKRNYCLNNFLNSQDHKKDFSKDTMNKLLLNHQILTRNYENNSLKIITSFDKLYDVILGDHFQGQCDGNFNAINSKIGMIASDLKDGTCKFNSDHTNRNRCKEYTFYEYQQNQNQTKMIDSIETLNGNEIIEDIFSVSPVEDKNLIKKMFFNALDCNKKKLIKYDEIIRQNAKNIFSNEVKNHEEKMKKEEVEHNVKPLTQYPTLANYNAEDRELMDRMLFDAFQYLRKNPKFVWAQLPEAHKVPILREWIARRFGKEYTSRDRCESYRTSCNIFRALNKSNSEYTFPSVKQIGKQIVLDYNCKKYLDKKVQYIKNKYHYHSDLTFLEYTRIFWFATRGYICSNGPPRKTFFSYMPSRLRDIHHFRLWKSYEFSNYKVFRNVQRHEI
ncbi:uncharacterized protein ACRADG_011572 isoform 2-T4 [Cochliomyia hominivorax]